MRVAREIATPGAAGDAQFSLLLDGKRCVLRFMIALVIGLAASVNGVTVAAAQTYPQRAVKFILPFGPAAGSDIIVRHVGIPGRHVHFLLQPEFRQRTHG